MASSKDGISPETQLQFNLAERHGTDGESPDAKRRKIRKGTRSCWECKRRKIRCNFASAADAVCIGCHRRGTHCVSQEYPEEAPRPAERGQLMGDRIVRVEALVEQLVRKVGNGAATESSQSQFSPADTSTPSSLSKRTPRDGEDVMAMAIGGMGIPTPSEEECEPARCVSFHNDSRAHNQSGNMGIQTPAQESTSNELSVPQLSGRYRTSQPLPTPIQDISNALHAVLPSAEVVRYIAHTAGRLSLCIQQWITRSYEDIDFTRTEADLVAEFPAPNAHPVLIARYALTLASTLQYLRVDDANTAAIGQDPHSLMKKLADTVVKYVTTNEEFMGTVESLECILLEGVYQTNSGNLRRAWLAFRRAMVVGQLMGIHRYRPPPLKKIDPNTRIDPQYIWYRILLADRYLCLMLGLPPGSLDQNFASEAALAKEPPMARLERMHAVIASHILERNEGDPHVCNYADTEAIDKELQKAAKTMPPKWWLPPNMSKLDQNHPDDVYWETIRMINQQFHYNLLNQLHLPYMMCFSGADAMDREHASMSDYSKATCVNASREVLNRFIAFRSWNKVAFCCRSVDFFALMAAMTLVLAHLHSQSVGCEHYSLAHQRLSDRAMMEQVLENMEDVFKQNMDPLSEKSGDLLRRLLEIEADSAEGRRYNATSVVELAHGMSSAAHQDGEVCTGSAENCAGSAQEGGILAHHAAEEEPGVLRMCIPYFGVIKIAREGGISKEPPAVAPSGPESASTRKAGYGPMGSSLGAVGMGGDNAGGNKQPLNMGHLVGDVSILQQTPSQQQFTPTQFADIAGQTVSQPFEYPGLAASADDWAFQGVDMTFFDSLMRGLDTTTSNPVPDLQPEVIWGIGLDRGYEA